MTTRIQFRTDEDDLAYLKAKGLNPNDVARDLFLDEVRRMRAEDRLARLQGMRVDLPQGGDEMVREDRDGRERWRPAGL